MENKTAEQLAEEYAKGMLRTFKQASIDDFLAGYHSRDAEVEELRKQIILECIDKVQDYGNEGLAVYALKELLR